MSRKRNTNDYRFQIKYASVKCLFVEQGTNEVMTKDFKLLISATIFKRLKYGRDSNASN
jgi:hypothetical protein